MKSYNFLFSLIFLWATSILGFVECDCRSRFTAKTEWFAQNVENGDDLRRVLQHDFSSNRGLLVKLQVINGTNWLNLGGNVDVFKLVIGVPPATASDVTLTDALSKLNQTGHQTGLMAVLVEFHPPELKNIADMESHNFMGVPVWSFQSVEGSTSTPDHPSSIFPALRWTQKRFGLDRVLERVAQENLLLRIDFERTKDILTTFYSYGHKPLTENSVTYLKRKYLTVQRQFPNTFTEVYLNNLLHLVESGDKMTGATLLPDLQELEVTYSKEDVKQVEWRLKSIPSADICVLLQVRAGIFLQSESVESLKSLLQENENRVKILVTSYNYDQVSVKRLMTAIDTLGRKNLILDFPESLTKEMKQVTHIPNHIQELAKSDTTGPSGPSCIVFFVSFLLRCLTV